MKITSAEFETSSPSLAGCPRWHLPEIAFIGRSNVGKSSLINLLAHRRELALTSSTPGKTKLLNFFRVNGTWSLVDLPGYGYAKVAQQDRHEFNVAVAEYLEKRPNLLRVCVLVDSRLEPQRIDLEFLRWLVGCDIAFTLIFTKTDKQSPTRTRASIAAFHAAIAEFVPETPPTFTSSALTKDGRGEILTHLGTLIAAAKGR